jgi:hypothetical protein
MAKYEEREITSPVSLCTADGKLNREAVGWSRAPLQTCNLSGNWPRKKKWNFWMALNEDFGFTATIANVDYLGVGAVSLLDLKGKKTVDGAAVIPRGIGVKMPDRVEEDVRLKDSGTKMAFTHTEREIHIHVEFPSFRAGKLAADITLEKPQGHETLNVVIPWSDDNFHFTSKQNTLPATGTVTIGDKTYEFKPENSFGVLDFGRGIWPSTIAWNWGAFSHRQDDDIIGLNIGAKWTDGTGDNENGVCLNGKLYKIMEDVSFVYDRSNFMSPWKIKTEATDMLDLTLTPIYDNSAGTNTPATDSKKVIASNHQMLGHFNGAIRAGDRRLEIKNAFGWAEEHIGNW